MRSHRKTTLLLFYSLLYSILQYSKLGVISYVSEIKKLLINVSVGGFYDIGKIEKEDIEKLKIDDSKNILNNIFSCGIIASDEELIDSFSSLEENDFFPVEVFSNLELFKQSLSKLDFEQRREFESNAYLYFFDNEEENIVLDEDIMLDIVSILKPLNKKTSGKNCDEYFLSDYFENLKAKKNELKVINLLSNL